MNKIKYAFTEALELPRDIVLDLPKITLVGKLQLNIENHKGVLEYSKDIIRVKGNGVVVKVYGNNMIIRSIIEEEIVISGEIKKIEYID
ncbi:sporulation protein YqfC [Clostridiisalibacter paucivorans]|uniref:sporulation protein YqfC n=1 Tax=Clostridiisalibacter paucivorans TaxID=408753 RepID=UPI00047CD10E|nr:sporulation protein YqfC [Clostridiisalibacter paucivorans]